MDDIAPPAPSPEDPRSGPEIIAEYVKSLPPRPGVYRMLDGAGEVLYVGKAKKLKSRVAAYAKSGGHNNRIALMIALTRSMEFVVTATETEALLLEANLIKKLKPRFNIILRDDKSFPYILIRKDHPAPQILKHRGARRIKGEYFGPFASAGAVNRTLNTLQKAFLLRSCSDSVYEGRSRPCMLYQIKRCSAPCVGYVDEARYQALVDEAREFLRGRSNVLRERLSNDMAEAAEKMEFERATRLRDRIRSIAAVTASQGVNIEGLQEADVVALAQEGGRTCVQVFFYRAGQNWGNRALYPKHEADAGPAEVMAAFLAQFYDNKPAPGLILVSVEPDQADLLAEALSLRADHKVEIRTPQKGEKKRLVDQVEANAREALGRKLAETKSQAQLLDGVKKVFGLAERPVRLEVYDNSHIQGANALGAMIVAGPEGFEKTSYRRFTMKPEDLATNDDYAMMAAMLRRRFARLAKERESGATAPDLALIDGGKGQLSAAQGVLAELSLEDVPIAAIAKGPDRDAGREVFYVPGKAPFRLPPNDPVLYYLQRLRDEAHCFAISGHRAKRAKQMRENPLDDIAGVGAARKKALLAHFGSARSVARANLADLEAVEGVSKALAQRIYDYFREGG